MDDRTWHETAPIPEPPAPHPLVSHALTMLGGVDQLYYTMRMAKELGPLYKLRLFDKELLVASGLDLVTELSDERRFRKRLSAELLVLRELCGGDGLITAFSDEPNWRKAHDILTPALSPDALRGYHAGMLEVARHLIGVWDRAAGKAPVDVPADMTRLTLDAIGLCGFGFDFASFRHGGPHPFVNALCSVLKYTQLKVESLPGTEKIFHPNREGQVREDIEVLYRTVDEVVRHRKATDHARTDDLLGRMLHVRDQATGELLDDVNLRFQVLTFLMAGHETTSGLMTFALYFLTKHPEVLARAQAEVDALWGDTDMPDVRHGEIGELTYIRQVLDECLRLWPTAPRYSVEPLEDTVIGGKYAVPKGTEIMVLTPALHRDPAWGDNVELFDPDRFSPERAAKRPTHLFKPFGNGERACIGRQFALHEATLALALLVHRYRLIDHTYYQLKLGITVSLKPADFTLRLVRRTAADRRGSATTAIAAPAVTARPAVREAPGTPLMIFYGSNLGTCAGIARDLAADGENRGFIPSVAALDDAVGTLNSAEGPVVIVAASYNGKPTDDAAQFVAWLDGLEPGSLDGLTYAVLGVGDRNWAATCQRIPSLIDERLTAVGAVSLLERGAADAAGDFAVTVDRWTDGLWAALLDRHGAPAGDATSASAEDFDTDEALYEVQEVAGSVTDGLAARHAVQPMEVLESRELVDLDHPLGRSKRFLRLRLPEGTTYRTGDHLAVLPRNPDPLVQRVADRFDLDLDVIVRLRARRRSRVGLPVDRLLTLRRLLTEFVELQAPATREQVGMLCAYTFCPPERRTLAELAAAQPEVFDGQVTGAARSVLDLLEQYQACELPFERFLEMLPVLRPRSYSISSSAAASPGEVDLMVSLLAAPHRSGTGMFRGTASHYLQTVRVGDTVQARVLPCREEFRLPQDTAVPVILVSAGTGLAPFRGAVMERLHTNSTGTVLCYFGCDHPEVDYLHRDELEAAEQAGVVSVRPTFMYTPENRACFVQDRIAQDSDEIWAVLEAGGRVHVCGDGRRMAPAVRKAFQDVYRDHTGADADDAAAWLSALVESGTYVEDVWAG